jgi:hypothetical protein
MDRMMNAEEASKATLKPHQCDIKATPKPVDSQLIGSQRWNDIPGKPPV